MLVLVLWFDKEEAAMLDKVESAKKVTTRSNDDKIVGMWRLLLGRRTPAMGRGCGWIQDCPTSKPSSRTAFERSPTLSLGIANAEVVRRRSISSDHSRTNLYSSRVKHVEAIFWHARRSDKGAGTNDADEVCDRRTDRQPIFFLQIHSLSKKNKTSN